MRPLPTNAFVVPQLPGFHRGAKALCGKTLLSRRGGMNKQESKGRKPPGVPRMLHCLNTAAGESLPLLCRLCEAVSWHETQREEVSKGEGAQAGIARFKPNQPTHTRRRKQQHFRAPIQGNGPVAPTCIECEILKRNPNFTLTLLCAVQLPRQIKLKHQKTMCEEMKNVHKKNCYA